MKQKPLFLAELQKNFPFVNIHKISGCVPGQLAPGVPARAERLDQMTSRGSL